MEYESPSQSPHLTMDERLKLLYPMVNEEETPLPRCWSTKVSFMKTNHWKILVYFHPKAHQKLIALITLKQVN